MVLKKLNFEILTLKIKISNTWTVMVHISQLQVKVFFGGVTTFRNDKTSKNYMVWRMKILKKTVVPSYLQKLIWRNNIFSNHLFSSFCGTQI